MSLTGRLKSKNLTRITDNGVQKGIVNTVRIILASTMHRALSVHRSYRRAAEYSARNLVGLTNWRWYWARPTEIALGKRWPPFLLFSSLVRRLGDVVCALYYNYRIDRNGQCQSTDKTSTIQSGIIGLESWIAGIETAVSNLNIWSWRHNFSYGGDKCRYQEMGSDH